VRVLATGLTMPNGVAMRGGDLYVAEVGRILRWRDIEGRLEDPGAPEVVTDAFPEDRHHGWKFIAFGPGGKLYVPVGAPCNICDPERPIYASITRMNPDGSNLEVYVHGVRNSVGFDWHPETKNLWFTDNGRDHLGDTKPPCEINRVTAKGQHFGYPYCHGGDIPDPEFGEKRDCSAFRPPARRLKAHAAPVGMRFYRGEMFPDAYRGAILVAEHGSWNRSRKVGYRVMRARVDGAGQVTTYTPFLTGFLDEASQTAWGRPVDVLELPDGSVLVSDDGAGAIYRVTYRSPD
jgi:glucose/arabinose dehydrogenase